MRFSGSGQEVVELTDGLGVGGDGGRRLVLGPEMTPEGSQFPSNGRIRLGEGLCRPSYLATFGSKRPKRMRCTSDEHKSSPCSVLSYSVQPEHEIERKTGGGVAQW